MDERSQKLQCQATINSALKNYRGDSYVEPPTKVIKSDSYEKLSRQQSDQGVIAFVHACKLSGGSVGNMDLYKLMRTYLWHPEARADINAIVSRFD